MASLDKEKQLEYNLAVLKRRDGTIQQVLNMSAHVVLYQFNEQTQVWDLKKVEGALFVVRPAPPPHPLPVSPSTLLSLGRPLHTAAASWLLFWRQVARSVEPRHVFVVLNRLSNENVVEEITAAIDTLNKSPPESARNGMLPDGNLLRNGNEICKEHS